MKVILRQDIHNLGRAGDVKEVRDGYGRNYLLPRQLVELATPGALKNWQLGADRRTQRVAKETAAAKNIADKMTGMTLSFTRDVAEGGQMFGSVSKADIAKSLKAAGHEIEKDCIELPAPVKVVGDTEVVIKLKPGVEAKIKVRVAPKAA